MKNNITPSYHTTIEEYRNYKNFKLVQPEGEEIALTAERCHSVYQITRKILRNGETKITNKSLKSQEVKAMSWSLRKTDIKELAEYRRLGTPSFVLKVDGSLYHTVVPEDLSLLSTTLIGVHKCAIPNHECSRLSAASDEDGGCAKVRSHACSIENYPFIKTGYELFGVNGYGFVVVECSHYKECAPSNKISPEAKKQLKLGLAQHIWEDIESHEQLRRQLRKTKYNL